MLIDIVNFILNLKFELCDEFIVKWIDVKVRNINVFIFIGYLCFYIDFFLLIVEIFIVIL